MSAWVWLGVFAITGILVFIVVLLCTDLNLGTDESEEDTLIKIFNKNRDKYIDSGTLVSLLLHYSGHYYYDTVAEAIKIEVPEGWAAEEIMDKYLSMRIFSKRAFKKVDKQSLIWSGTFNNRIAALYMDMLPATRESLIDAEYAMQVYESDNPEVKRNRLLQEQNDLLRVQGDRNAQQMEDLQKILAAGLLGISTQIYLSNQRR